MPATPAPPASRLIPWLLAMPPLCSILFAAGAMRMAAGVPVSMVVDDYYKQGKAINLDLGRDQQASQLGLRAELQAGTGSTRLRLYARQAFPLPATVQVRFMHPADAARDQQLSLQLGSDQTYTGQPLMLTQGTWEVQIDTPAQHWRLRGLARLPAAQLTLHAQALAEQP
jgi:hypothetical protein